MIKENRNLTTNIIKNTIKGMKIKIIIRRKETSKINKIIKRKNALKQNEITFKTAKSILGEEDFDLLLQYLEKSNNVKKNDEFYYYIGRMYQKGKRCVQKNIEKAIQFFQKSIPK